MLKKVRMLGNNDYTFSPYVAWGISGFYVDNIRQTIEENILDISDDCFFMFTARNRLYVLREHQDRFLRAFRIKIDLSYLSIDLILELIDISHRICEIYESDKLGTNGDRKFEVHFKRDWGELKIHCFSCDVFEVLYFIKHFNTWARQFIFRKTSKKEAP